MRLIARVSLCFLLASAYAMPAERNTQIISEPVYLHPQRLVAIDHRRRLNIYCTGKGTPTVIFDSGLGEDLIVWALVQPAVSAATRACSYDRAGLGFSDPGTRPGTSANVVDDLHRLLRAAHVRPPYVLVGHSFGGMNIKLYAETSLPEVAGLVFVDPSHEDLARRSWEISPELGKRYPSYIAFLHTCLSAKPADFVPGSKLQKNCATVPNSERFSDAINVMEQKMALTPGNRGAWISEQEYVWSASADQVRAAHRSLGDVPLIVLTHEPLPRQTNETQAIRDAQNQVRTELHTEIAHMSTRGSIRVVENSEHHFQLDQPQEVTKAILEVVGMARAAVNRGGARSER